MVLSSMYSNPPMEFVMPFMNFYGVEEAYWWILSTEKYFRAKHIVEDEEKMKVVEIAMRGRALKWWKWRSQSLPSMSWDTFADLFLWYFKPEWRHLFQDLDEEIEPTYESMNSIDPIPKTILEETSPPLQRPLSPPPMTTEVDEIEVQQFVTFLCKDSVDDHALDVGDQRVLNPSSTAKQIHIRVPSPVSSSSSPRAKITDYVGVTVHVDTFSNYEDFHNGADFIIPPKPPDLNTLLSTDKCSLLCEFNTPLLQAPASTSPLPPLLLKPSDCSFATCFDHCVALLKTLQPPYFELTHQDYDNPVVLRDEEIPPPKPPDGISDETFSLKHPTVYGESMDIVTEAMLNANHSLYFARPLPPLNSFTRPTRQYYKVSAERKINVSSWVSFAHIWSIHGSDFINMVCQVNQLNSAIKVFDQMPNLDCISLYLPSEAVITSNTSVRHIVGSSFKPVEAKSESNVQWALGKAGEDRVHLVVSNKQGWLFVGIYDGFHGPDAPEFLTGHMYRVVHNELQGLFWEVEEPIESHSSVEVKNKPEGENSSAGLVQRTETATVAGTESKRRGLWEFLAEDPKDGLDLSGPDRFAFSVYDALRVSNNSKAGSASSRRWLLLSKLKNGLSTKQKEHPLPSRIPSQPHACSHISSCKEESQHCKINSMYVSSLKKESKSANGVLNSKSIHGEASSFKYNILRLPKWAQAKVAHCNEAITVFAVVRVIRSKDSRYNEGDIALCPSSPVAEYAIVPSSQIARKIDTKNGISLSDYLGSLGVPGFAAWVGIEVLGDSKAASNVFISAASGAVGMNAGQLAKIRGCRVIRSTGSDDKVKLIKGIFFFIEVNEEIQCGMVGFFFSSNGIGNSFSTICLYAHEVKGIMAIVMMLILSLISVLVCPALIMISALNIRVPLNTHKHISKQTNNIAAI